MSAPNPLDAHLMGTGCWAWGDTLTWGYGRGYGEPELRAAFEASLAAGIRLFDTAEAYGFGKSEAILGAFAASVPEPVYIASKFLPLPWRVTSAQFMAAVRHSLARLRRDRIDLYQLHWNQPPIPLERWVNGLADALEANLIGAAGVSNYNRAQIERAHDTLAKRGHRLASNQLEYSLIARDIEFDGTLAACRERGIRVIAYSPLGMGVLTGKYRADFPPPGLRGRTYRALLPTLPPLLTLLKELGDRHGKLMGQVALNWTLCKGTLPIPGAKSKFQLLQNAEALGWRLADDEIAALDAESARLRQKQ